MIILKLFFDFFKIGLFAVGGGMAAIPFLRHLSLSTDWYPIAFITDMIAISESTPGPIGINMATYAGFTIAGLPGGIVATLGMIMPSIIIVTIVASYLARVRESQLMAHVFMGLRPAVTALIAIAAYDIIRTAVLNFEAFNGLKVIYFLLVFYLIRRYKKHPIAYVALSAGVGVLLNFA